MGIPPITVSQWVRGKRVPSVPSCYAIADAFDLPDTHVLREARHPTGEEVDVDKELEDRLVSMWQKLSPHGQQAVLEFVEFHRSKERKAAQ
jgi:transcriptional regulator with XRE-family HTH domain